MKKMRWITGVFVIAGLAIFLFVSCSSVSRTVLAPPEIEGAHFVGNHACVDCHTNISRIFNASVHGRFYKDDPKWFGKTGCESCHGPASKHVAAGGGRGKFIINPRKDPTSCFQCHLDVHAQFNLPQHHPVLESKMNCVQCHDPHGHEIFKPAAGLAMARQNQACAQCHREQTRVFVFEHAAMREGCVTCHTPHGSINGKMLVERDNNLCLKCHSQIQTAAGAVQIGKMPGHTGFTRFASCWAAGCHAAVHGSNIHPKLTY